MGPTFCEIGPTQCSGNWDPLTNSRLTKWDTQIEFFKIFNWTYLYKFVRIEWDPIFTVLFIYEMNPLL
jgi:hypothetical protein